MQTAVERGSEPAPSGPAGRPPWRPSAAGSLGWLVAGYLVQVALRVAISIGRDGPTIFADETGYLINARVIGGGIPGELRRAALYRGGYSLLLLPAHWLGGGPLSEFRWVLLINAVVSSLVFPLVYLLLSRPFRVPARTALVAAFLAALYPPLVVTTQFAAPESLLPVLVLLAAVALAGIVAARTSRAAVAWALVCGACAGALATTHSRTAPLLALLVLLLLVLAVLRRDLLGAPLAGVALAVAVTLAGQRLNAWLNAQSWGSRQDADLQHVLDNARSLGSLKNVAALVLGQYWYLFVATFGLVVLGLVHAAARTVPRAGESVRRPPAVLRWAVRREGGGAPLVGVFLLGSVAGLAVLAAWFLDPPLRPDHVVYGRYLEIMAPPLVGLGVVRLWALPARRLLLELAAGTGVALVACLVATVYAGGLVSRGTVNWYTVLALPVLAQTRDQIRPVTATAVALVGAGFLLVLARRRVWATLGLAAVLVATTVALRAGLVEARDQAIYGTQPVELSTVPGLADARVVAYDLAASTPVGLYGYQWQLERARFVLFDSRRDPVPRTEWVIAGSRWRQATAANAQRVWVHAPYDQALWHLPAGP
jgi:4-amino-4-deoxy-L-arabinose transferase-like glycosyltransferase